MTETGRGTPGYKAPELLQPGRITYSNKVDIWAVGCIFYLLVFHTKVFNGNDNEVLRYGQQCTHQIAIPSDRIPDKKQRPIVQDILGSALHFSPLSRPEASDIHTRILECCRSIYLIFLLS